MWPRKAAWLSINMKLQGGRILQEKNKYQGPHVSEVQGASLWACKVSQMGMVTLILPLQRADNCQKIIKTTFTQCLQGGTTFTHRPLLNTTSEGLNPSSEAVILTNTVPDFHCVEAAVPRNPFRDFQTPNQQQLPGWICSPPWVCSGIPPFHPC